MGFIAEETIQRVIEATDIVELVGSYFPLKRAGTSFRALCPFHREKSPSFHVNPARQNYHCFGCGAGGGALRFVMDYEHLDFPSAVRRLAQRAGIPVLEGENPEGPNSGERARLVALHVEAAAWMHDQLLKSPSAAHARDYLKGRGLTSTVAKEWQLGYAPESWDGLLQHLRSKRFTREEILLSGLASSKDTGEKSRIYARFRDRLMFPICNDYGEVIAFSGRILNTDPKAAKYVNSPETPVFTKGKVLYGLHKTKRDLASQNAAIVCEGQLDLIAAYGAGVRHVIAPQGTAFTPDQARILKRFVETVLLCFDSDTAGRKATLASLPALLSHGLHVRVVRLPAGEDPDSLIRGRGADEFLEVVNRARDFFENALDEALEAGEVADAAGKSRFVRRMGPVLARIPDSVFQESCVAGLCARLGVSPGAVRTHMKVPATKDEAAEIMEAEPPPPLPPAIEMLARLAIASGDARAWLRSHDPVATLDPAGDFVDRIAALDFDESGTPPAGFLAGLNVQEERAFSKLVQRTPGGDLLQATQLNYQGLQIAQIQARIENLKGSISAPALSTQERQSLQKQILDLTIRLAEVRRPFSQA